MDGKKRKTAVLAMAAVLSVMMIASPLAVMAEETAPAAPEVTQDGNVQKETAPAIRLPENLRAKAGTALKDVALPGPWTWADDSTVITAGTAEYPARLCVDDAAYDYSKAEGYNVGGGSYVERMVAVTAEGAKAEAAGPVKGKPRGLPGDPPATYGVGDIDIDDTNFPDAEFQDYIETFDLDHDKKLSAAEIADIKTVDVHGNTDIKSLTGIEHFTALETLRCDDTGIGSLDVSSNKKLMTLLCNGTPSLTNLKVEGAEALKTLDCNHTGIGSLDVSSNMKLENMNCGNTPSLTNLKVEGAEALETLRCFNTGIGSLDVSSNKELTILECYDSASLTNLKVEGAEALKFLRCYKTGIGSLDVSSNKKLMTLLCYKNASLTSLTVEGAEALETLECYETGIGNLDVSSNKELTELKCYDSASLTNLKVEGAEALKFLYCYKTGIGSLDVSSNKNLETLTCYENASLTSLTVEGAEALESLECYKTGIGSLDVSSNEKLDYLSCYNNPLAYLNIGVNNKLINVNSGSLKPVKVTVPSDHFKMADKFAGIDANAVDDKSVRGAVYDKTSGTMSNYRAGTPITYTYHCGTSSSGKEETIEVTLNITLGSTITRTYTVEEKAPSGGVKDSDNNHDGTKTDKKAAQTGDPANVGVLAAMILLSSGCMFFLIRKKGQKK